jgi:putative zinc finger/helix-turn-helix YgiT family protein
MSKCISCDASDLQPGTVELKGVVRGEEFTVEMQGLVCPNCRYTTIEGGDMPEYGRLLADKYRAKHGLLGSAQIRARRERLGLSQQNFADYLKRGVASVKRWEMGKIQDPDNDRHIREMTDPKPDNTWIAFQGHCNGSVSPEAGTTVASTELNHTVFSTIVVIDSAMGTGACVWSAWSAFFDGQTQRNTSSVSNGLDFSSAGTTALPRIERRTHAREH